MSWEYCTVEWRGTQALDATLATLGAEGWQLSEVYLPAARDHQILIFTRPLGR